MPLQSTLNKYEQVIQRETRMKSKQKKQKLYPGDVSVYLATNKTTKGYQCAQTTLKQGRQTPLEASMHKEQLAMSCICENVNCCNYFGEEVGVVL